MDSSKIVEITNVQENETISEVAKSAAPETHSGKRPKNQVAIDRDILNVTRKVYKNNKSGDKKLVELLIHVFDNCGSTEEKMEALAKKYVELAADHKETEQASSDMENKFNKARKERDHLQTEHNKMLIAKGKLESLCRELQKHNKSIKEETQKRADEEDRKRKELSQKFQATISDITQQMADNHKRNQQLNQDNNDLAVKLKGLVEQYEVREQHIEKVLKAKQLELQLCEAKLQQQQLILQEETENNMREKHGLLEESLLYKKKCEEMLRQEADLRAQLSLYTEKFEEFQSTLTKSNEVFGTFKKDMDTMTKTIRKLEKESAMWKTRWENTNKSLIAMVDERTQNLTTITTLNTKVEKLEKLCRALQVDRNTKSKEEKEERASESDCQASTACQHSDTLPKNLAQNEVQVSTNQPIEANEAAESDERHDAPTFDKKLEEKPSSGINEVPKSPASSTEASAALVEPTQPVESDEANTIVKDIDDESKVNEEQAQPVESEDISN